MDQDELVSEQIAAGTRLITALDESDFTVIAAMWFYKSEIGEWRLIIASPYVDKNGPKKSYEFIQDILNELSQSTTTVTISPLSSYISLNNITVIGKNDDLIRLLRSAIRTEYPVRFTRNVINNTLIEDVLIYRMR